MWSSQSKHLSINPQALNKNKLNSQSEIGSRGGPQLSVRGIIFMDAKSEICFRWGCCPQSQRRATLTLVMGVLVRGTPWMEGSLLTYIILSTASLAVVPSLGNSIPFVSTLWSWIALSNHWLSNHWWDFENNHNFNFSLTRIQCGLTNWRNVDRHSAAVRAKQR